MKNNDKIFEIILESCELTKSIDVVIKHMKDLINTGPSDIFKRFNLDPLEAHTVIDFLLRVLPYSLTVLEHSMANMNKNLEQEKGLDS